MTQRVSRAWTTNHELRYLDLLGTHRRQPHSHPKLLKKYLQAMKLRKYWNGLDSLIIEEHAKRLLESY